MIKATLLWALGVLVAFDLLARLDPPQPLPLAHAAWERPGANPDLLFAPCPMSPANRPKLNSQRSA
jgi:hypothetical protein